MAKSRAEVDGRNVILTEDENPVMHLKVRKKGAGKISTGVHDPKGGDFLYEEGETLSVRRDVAQPLLDLDYVDEISAADMEAAAKAAEKAAQKAAAE
jgi:hypothetical protein